MKKPRIKKLSMKIFLCSILPIALAYIVTSLIGLFSLSDFASTLIQRETLTTTVDVVNSLDSYFSDILEAVEENKCTVSLSDYLDEADGKTYKKSIPTYTVAQTTLNRILNLQLDGVKSVWLADFSGSSVFTDSTTNYSAERQDFRSQKWYNSSKIENGIKYATLGSALGDGSEDDISIIIPVRGDSGKITGVCGITIEAETLGTIIGKEAEEGNGYYAVITTDGTFVYHSHDAQYVGTNIESCAAEYGQASALISDMDETEIKNVEFNNELWYVKLYSVENSDFYAYTAVPASDAYIKISPIVTTVFVTIIVGFISFAVLTLFLTHGIVAPIKNVTILARNMADGNYTHEITLDSDDEIGTLVKTFNQAIQNLRYRTSHDPLTGIYNADGLFNEIEQLFIQNPQQPYSLVRMDIDKFKIVNDLHGWDEGDNLLRYTARVISEEISEGSIVGRYNSDIFMMCLDTDDQLVISELLTRIKNIIGEYSININVMPYFGVYEVTDKYTAINMMFDRATLAVKSIKGNVVSFYAFYDDALRSRIILRKKLESDMSDALINRQFYIVVQPKCDIVTGRVVGGESLVRWNHPADGIIRPDVFIPVFEQNGFVMRLDEFVWEETCKLIAGYMKNGYEIVPISINVSRLHIFDTGFCDKISALVEKYGIPPKYLELEFTESAFLTNLTQLYDVMNTLKNRGFVLSMDDFASGYSSLNMLKNAPFDVVKIDREFITEAVNNTKGRKLINGTIALINQLDMRIVAEGVETREQAEFLVSAGCTVAQGYYYAKPLKTDEFEKMAYLATEFKSLDKEVKKDGVDAAERGGNGD